MANSIKMHQNSTKYSSKLSLFKLIFEINNDILRNIDIRIII